MPTSKTLFTVLITAASTISLSSSVRAQQVIAGDVRITQNCNVGDGQLKTKDGRCITQVKFLAAPGLNLDQAKKRLEQDGLRLATPEEVEIAWQAGLLDRYSYGMMSDGRFAVPVQRDYSNFKTGANIGATGGNQGLFYVQARYRPPATDTKLAKLSIAPAQASPPQVSSQTIRLSSSTPSGPIYVRQGDPVPQQYFVSQAADFCADPGNFMLDGWNSPSRGVLEEAARGFFPKFGWPNTSASMVKLRGALERDGVMRWEFAPYMLEAAWRAITATTPTPAQSAFKHKFEVWTGCDKNLMARRNIVRWNQAMGRHIDSSINGVSVDWIDPNPSYKPVTLGILNDTGPSITSTGYDVTNGGNPMWIGSKGRDTVAKLYQPLALVNAPEVNDLEDLRLIRQQLPRFVYGGAIGLTTGGVASLIMSMGINNSAWTTVLTRSRTAEANAFIKNNEIDQLISEKARIIAQQSNEPYETVLARLQEKFAEDTARSAAAKTTESAAVKTSDKLADDLVSFGLKRAGTEAAEKLGEETAKQLAVRFIGSAAGPVLSGVSFFASVFGEKLADIVKTNDYQAALLRDMSTYKPFDVTKFMGPNPTEAQKAPIFNLLVKMTIAEPADRHNLTLEVPGLKCPLGSNFIAGACRRKVEFYRTPNLTLKQAKDIAARYGWTIASAADVKLGWEAKMIDTFAYGMMADGRFAVPIQSSQGSFKTGPNIGVTGGNQGFFYYQDFVGPKMATGGSSYIQNASDLEKFIVYQNSYQANAASTKPQNPFASWRFEKVDNNYRIVNTAQGPKSYIANDLDVYTSVDDNKDLWKIIKADRTFYRIESASMPHRYLTLGGNGQLKLDYIKSNEKAALWNIPAGP